jgi:hypothetical protein
MLTTSITLTITLTANTLSTSTRLTIVTPKACGRSKPR